MTDRFAPRTTGPAPVETPDLAAADVVLVNTSGGKDSQVLLDEVHRLAALAGATDKLLAVHCDLGVVEWADAATLAEEQANHYGVPFTTVSRTLGNLLDQIADRRVTLDGKSDKLGAEADAAAPLVTDVLAAAVVAALRAKASEAHNASAFPNSSFRYCTSDQKTSQVKKLFTRLAEELGAAGKLGEPVRWTKATKKNPARPIYRPIRIVNCLGMRAQESDFRSKMVPVSRDEASNGVKDITRWLPIHHWTEDEVWARIKESGVRHHRAYDLGMSRLSCAFCVFASKSDLKVSARANRQLAEEYVALEELTRSRFTDRHSMAEILAEVDAEDACKTSPSATVTPLPARRPRVTLEVAAA